MIWSVFTVSLIVITVAGARDASLLALLDDIALFSELLIAGMEVGALLLCICKLLLDIWLLSGGVVSDPEQAASTSVQDNMIRPVLIAYDIFYVLKIIAIKPVFQTSTRKE